MGICLTESPSHLQVKTKKEQCETKPKKELAREKKKKN